MREISVAAKMGGADIGSNARPLHRRGKGEEESVTKDAIQRAINKGAGIGDEKLVMNTSCSKVTAPNKVA